MGLLWFVFGFLAGIVVLALVLFAFAGLGTTPKPEPFAEFDAIVAEKERVRQWFIRNRNTPKPVREDGEDEYEFRYRYGDAIQAMMIEDGFKLRHTQWSEHLYVSQENPVALDVLA